MTPESIIEGLESTPLLGNKRIAALTELDALAQRIDPEQHPTIAMRLVLRRFQATPVTSATLAQLSTAEAWATHDDMLTYRTRIRLIWCTHVGRQFPGAVPTDVLADAVAHAKEMGTLEAEWRLALAVVSPDEASNLRTAALKVLPSPSEDATRIETLLDLADDQFRGSDTVAALHSIEQAVDIATHHNDSDWMCATLLRLGLAHIEQGRNAAAMPHLQHAFNLACAAGNDLNVIMAGTPLAAMHMSSGAHQHAALVADKLLISGARRANWFAVVDAHITHSAILLESGDPTGAISRLVRAAVHLRELVPAAAINLLKGRLAELRHQMGSRTFDEHYKTAVAHSQGPTV
jgi:hypothetical protein